MTYKENEVTDNVRLNKYLRNDVFLFDTVADTRQKSLDHEINVRVTYKQYEVTDCVRLNKCPKYDAFLFDTVGDTGQNQWIMKYRSQRPA